MTPLVVHIGHPVYHTHRFTVDIHLEAVPVVDLERVGINLGAALSYCKDAISHLKADDLPFFETVVCDRGVDITVLIPCESRKKQQKQKTKNQFLYCHTDRCPNLINEHEAYVTMI
jgi:hypothetical protein